MKVRGGVMNKYKLLIVGGFAMALNLLVSMEAAADRHHRHHHNRNGVSINLGGAAINFGPNRRYNSNRCYKYFVYDVWGNRKLVRECRPRQYYRSW